jgi:lysozyme
VRRITAEGIAFIKQWEGCRLDAYQCSAGKWTIGYGHTKTAQPGMKITQGDAERLLVEDLRIYEAALANAVDVTLTDNQFAALVSWTYNIGVGAMRRSTLIKKLNAGDYAAVPLELAKWNKVKGRVVSGLSNRRAAEAGLWARGEFVASRDIVPADTMSTATAATQTGTGKAAIGVGAAGVVSTVAQHSDAIANLGFVGPVIGVALVVTAAILFVLWRKGHI